MNSTRTPTHARDYDKVLVDIADYVVNTKIEHSLAYQTAHYCLWDALSCAALALNYPACTRLLGPVVPNINVPNGVRVPGTDFVLDPIKAAFDIGILIRWLDYNDTWLAAEWGHPSDNLGAILAVADYQSQNGHTVMMRDVLTAMIKAYEIQGVIALENSFNQVGLDHVILVKLASTAVITHLLGGTEQAIINALSQVCVDGQSLRTYRHAPNTGSRKSWAAADAASRAVMLAMLTLKGEIGYPSALSAPRWGFYDVLFKKQPFKLNQPYASYVIENILFKIKYPAEFHATTAVECALVLHPQIKNKLESISKILITTQKPAIDIISKTGPLYNPADRDHCLQYIVAVTLYDGNLTADSYETASASRPDIDQLRALMEVKEDKQFTHDYYDASKRSIANAIQILFKDGNQTEQVRVDYPVGHRRRRDEGIPELISKCQTQLKGRYQDKQLEKLLVLLDQPEACAELQVKDFMGCLATA